MASDAAQRTIGKYQVLGPLGRGAMGLVYKAQDPEIGRVVAIKTLRKLASAHLQDPEAALERFRNEARSAGNLRHQNIITIFEVGRDGDTPFIVMDYVEGRSLEEILAAEKKLPPTRALHYLTQIGAGLDYAHKKGVIHRDIKPANILIDKADNVFILDFGIASMQESFGGEAPAPGSLVLGTPGYMAPEQILNEKLDHRADLFACAIVAFECFSGERPYRGETFTEVIGNIVNGAAASLASVAPHLPLALEAEFRRALARDRDHRFSSAGEMIAAFRAALPEERAQSGSVPAVREPRRSDWATPPGTGFGAGPTAGRTTHTAVRPAKSTAMSSAPFRDSRGGAGFTVRSAPGGWSVWRTGALVLGAVSAVLAIVLIGHLLTGGEVEERRQTAEEIEDRLASRGAAAGAPAAEAVGEPQLNEPNVEDAPAGKPIAELSDRQVLGVIVSPRSAEGSIIEALREGLRRRLGELPDAAVVPLTNDSYAVRIEAIKVLAELRDRRVVPRLVLVLDDHDPLVRAQAARTLGALGDKRALGYLSARLGDEAITDVRAAIKSAIESIQGVPAER